MNHSHYEENFLSFIDGSLSPDEREELARALETDAELKRSFERYKGTIEIERLLAEEKAALHPSFTARLMEEIETTSVSPLRAAFDSIRAHSRILAGATAALAILTITLRIGSEQSYSRNVTAKRAAEDTLPARDEPAPSQQESAAAPKESVPLREMEKSAPRKPSPAGSADGSSITAPGTGQDTPSLAEVRAALEAARQGTAAPGIPLSDRESGSLPAPQAKNSQSVIITERGTSAMVDGSRSNGGRSDPSKASAPAPGGSPAATNKSVVTGSTLGLTEPGVAAAGAQEQMASQERFQDPILRMSSDITSLERKSVPVPAPSASQAQNQWSATIRDRVPPSAKSIGGEGALLPEEKTAFEAFIMRNADKNTEQTAEIFKELLERVNEPDQNTAVGSYGAYEENQRISVRDEATSTFSIDVDTGSYTNVRRFLSQGMLPPPDSVRAEEFINYFDYNYPAQYEKPFALFYEIAPSPLDKGRYLLKLGLKARDARSDEKPWNLVFLIDVSGSMATPDRLELVKRSLKVLVDNMRSEDRVSIVTYAGSTGIQLNGARANERERILHIIDSLGAGGSTNGSSGIQQAYEVAQRNRIDGGVNRVILATDGDFNVGVTSQDELVKLIDDKRRAGITLTTIGVGTDNYKEPTLEQLADKGNGNYFYLDSFKEARKVFETDLFGTMEVVAKDVKLQVEFNPEHVAEYRLIGYDNRKLRNQDFHNDAVDAGEIGSGHTVTALYEIVLTGSELAKQMQSESRYKKDAPSRPLDLKEGLSNELGFLQIRYKEPNGDTSKLLKFPLERGEMKDSANAASQDFRFASAVAYFAQLLRHSQYLGNYSFDDVLELAKANRGEDSRGYRQEFIELVKDAKALSKGK